ncbi:MAG: quinone oxidoreductase, partial [Myxococcota bacterium]|nr:quinone oxidoreductase [Myxococcota bacterium]
MGAQQARVVEVPRTGGAEVLAVAPRPVADPGPGQVRVTVRAAGVNFIDVYFRTGLYPRETPFILGLEGAGVVEAVGPQVEGLAEGDRVAWAAVPGSYAEAVVAPAASLVRVPEGVDDETAAAVMLQGMTAHYLTEMRQVAKTAEAASPVPGAVALVHAAAGGVGLLLVQMLKEAGATVIGTCGAEEKERLAREAGCDHVVRYDLRDFREEVERLTGGARCTVVYDSVGASTFDGSLASLRPRGLLALFGQSSGPVPPFDLQRLNAGGSLFVTRPSLAHYTATREELKARAGAVFTRIRDGRLRVRVGARYPLAEAAEAHRALEGRRT